MADINDLRIGINQSLDDAFPNVNIYGEEIKQGFKEPCFFVKVLDSDMSKELGRRYKENLDFDVHYFSDKEDINSDCFYIVDRLCEVLESIEVNGLRFGANKMKHEVIDGVLHFTLQFNHHVFKQLEDVEKMNRLEVKLNEK